MSAYLIVREWTSAQIAYAANENKASYVTGAILDGYELVGHVGFYIGDAAFQIANIFKTNSTQIRFDIKNVGSETKTVTLHAWVLLRKVS